jgi:hypothetical protein
VFIRQIFKLQKVLQSNGANFQLIQNTTHENNVQAKRDFLNVLFKICKRAFEENQNDRVDTLLLNIIFTHE